MYYDLKYCNDELPHTITISVDVQEGCKIPESVINKALMITMNYIMENVETDKQEEPE